MNVLTVTWPCWLAAVVLALFGAGCAEAVADDQPLGGPAPAAVAGDPAAVEGQVALLAEEKEGEAREREARQREEAELREREARQRKEAEAREGEKRERKEGEAREREGGERREAEAGRAPLAQELGRLEEKARDIRRRLEGLRDGQDAEARELQGALREVEGRIEAIRRELRGPEGLAESFKRQDAERATQVLKSLRERHKALSEQAAALQRELEGLRRDDQAEQARKLRDKLAQVRAAADLLQAEVRRREQQVSGPREGADRPRPDREQLVRRLEELKAVVGRLAEAGKRDEAEANEREVREIIRLLEVRPDLPPPPAGVPEELQRRIGHLKVAIENLRAAGLNEQAQQLVQQVDRLIEEHRRLTGRAPEPPRPPEPRERPVPPELVERLEQQGPAIRELNAAMNELRQQMAELRQMIQQLRQPERPERR
jgi:chromosome segregation ATPase